MVWKRGETLYKNHGHSHGGGYCDTKVRGVILGCEVLCHVKQVSGMCLTQVYVLVIAKVGKGLQMCIVKSLNNIAKEWTKISEERQNLFIKYYIERALSHGCSSIDSSHITRSPEHWWHVSIPCLHEDRKVKKKGKTN